MIDLRKISQEKLNKVILNYENYKPLFIKYKKEKLYENTFSEDIKTLEEQLKLNFDIKDWQMEICDIFNCGLDELAIKYKYDNLFEIVIPDIEKNIYIIDNFLNKRGYNKIYQKIDEYVKIPCTFIHLIYVPKFQNNIKNEILKYGNIIYHLTKKSNVNNIKQNGLIPQNREGKDNIFYDKRLYFFLGNISLQDLENYAYNTLSDNTESYCVLYIDVNKLDDNIEFYYDPLYGKESIYTTEKISYNSIIKIIDL